MVNSKSIPQLDTPVQQEEDKAPVSNQDPRQEETTLPVFAFSGPAPTHPVGSMIAGHYRVVAKLGTGGMGTVYKCEHSYLKRTVAIKVLNNRILEDGSAVRRFLQEAQAAANFDHPGIPAVREFGVDERGFPFLVMDFVDGELLSVRMRRAPLSLQEACRMAEDICDALSHAHEKKIIHRDIKPSNIMLCGQEGEMTAVLLDFGVAKVIDAVQESHLTETGELLGTITYMSPEQSQGLTLDHRADIYALGCTLYEALSGSPPFTGSNRIEVIMKHQQAEPPDLPASVPNELQQIVFRCLEKQPAKRFPSALAMRRDLDLFLHGRKPRALLPRFKARWRRRIYAAGIGIPSLAALSALLWIAFHPQNELEQLNRDVDSRPKDASTYYKRALYYINCGRRKIAVSDLSKAVALAPGQASFHYWLARCAVDMWNPAEALKQCARALELAPKFSSVLVVRAAAQAELGRYGEAVSDYEKAVAGSDDTTLSEALMRVCRSNALHSLGRDRESLAEAEAALRLAPDNLDARIALIDALTGLAQYHQALDNCQLILSITERSSRLTLTTVQPEIGLGQLKAALDDINESAPSNGKMKPMPLLWRARIYLSMKRAGEAAADASDALLQQPANPMLYFCKARACLALNKNDEALAACDKAISLQPRYANAFMLRSFILSREGKHDMAQDAFTNACTPGMVALNDMGVPQDATVGAIDANLKKQAQALLDGAH